LQVETKIMQMWTNLIKHTTARSWKKITTSSLIIYFVIDDGVNGFKRPNGATKHNVFFLNLFLWL
jgi:hypothetical protein